jgi:hypothetical protein
MSEQILEGSAEFFIKTIGINDNKGLFCIAKADHPASFIPSDAMDQRCDAYRNVGPRGFHMWDETTNLCSCGSTDKPNAKTGNHKVIMEQLKSLFPVIEAVPYGFLLYLEFRDDETEEETLVAQATTFTRSIQEVFRLLLEWEFAATQLGSTEDIATTAAGMASVLDIPQNLRDWIINQVPPEKVGRYLAGNPNARARTTEPIPDLSQEFHDWVYNKMKQCRSFGEYDV